MKELQAAQVTTEMRMPKLVVGLGLTGWSIVRHLASRGETFVVTDTRPRPPYYESLLRDYPEIRFVPDMDLARLEDFAEVITSPGIAVEGSPIGDIELFAREADAPVIVITGSNGKSTVTMLVVEILRGAGKTVAVGGNIGTPALDLLVGDKPDFYVLEVSSFQLETTYSLCAASAAVLNISEDHMDRYASLNDYAQAKFRAFEQARYAVINRDDPWVRQFTGAQKSVSFGLDAPEDGQFGIEQSEGKRFFVHGHRRLAEAADMTLKGEQNTANMLAAMALVSAAGVELGPAAVELGTRYQGLPHRCQVVGRWNQVTWINDSKGTNVGATLAAIEGCDPPIILILGGMGKGADFTLLARALHRRVRHVVLFGQDSDLIADVIRGAVYDEKWLSQKSSLAEVVKEARLRSRPGDTVLFSPACASFDMFDGFEQRGEAFMELVRGH